MVEDLPEESDVGDCQAKSVDLGETLLIGKGGDMEAKLFESGVDAGGAADKNRRMKKKSALTTIFGSRGGAGGRLYFYFIFTQN